MRPLLLTMQAFGPYAGTEVVDFEKAIGTGLFGIYGPTGSGKSSIFSAMTFALFGETARGGQDIGSLRSHHADVGTFTQVDFVFDVGAKRYLIRRCPDQERPALRGDKMVIDRHSAWLFDVTGLSTQEITEDNSGKVIAETKVREVDNAIRELLGYGAEQFRQIVLLPQGKFETFLTASTTERVDILRELFDVSLYQQLTETLKEIAGSARQEIIDERKLAAALLTEQEYENLDHLAEQISIKENDNKQLRSAKDAAASALEASEKILSEAQSLNGHFVAKLEAEQRLQELSGQTTNIAKLREMVSLGRKSRQAVDLEMACEDAVKAANQAKYEASEAEENVITSKERQTKAEAVVAELATQKPEQQKQEEQLRLLDGCQKSLEGSLGLKAKMDDAHGALNAAKTEVSQLENKISELNGQKEQLGTALKQSADVERKRSELEKVRGEINTALSQAQAYNKAVENCDEARQKLDENLKARDEVETKLQAAREAGEEAETALASAQAHHLAKNLADGEPCPVCGSKNHPDPANIDLQGQGLNDAFKEARAYLKSISAEAEGMRAAVGSQEGILEHQKKALAELPVPEESLDALQDRLEDNNDQLNALAKYEKPEELQDKIDAVDEKLNEFRNAEPEKRTISADADVEFRTAKNAYSNALKAIPEKYQSSEQIEAAKIQCQNWIDDFTDKVKHADQEKMETATALAAAEAKLQSAIDNLGKAKSSLSSTQSNFESRLKELELDKESYNSGKAALDQIETYNERIRAHEDGVNAAKTAIASAEEKIADCQRPDLAALEGKKAEAAAANEQAVIALSKAQTALNAMKDLHENVSKKFEELDAAEEEYKILGRLADDFRGENSSKINLETYAIAAMFDHVLEAANLRLTPMSGGRYTLERGQEGQEKGRGKRGLGIAVFDTNTGRQRSTQTLSGGESFMAALALALGLSDIVQNTRGAVRLDTIFIDEGFGSLDPDSLDQALQTLQELTSGSRSVGIISHVDLVKQEIPHGFQIDKTLNGSAVTERMLE